MESIYASAPWIRCGSAFRNVSGLCYLRTLRDGEYRNRPAVSHERPGRDRGSSTAGRNRRHAENPAARLPDHAYEMFIDAARCTVLPAAWWPALFLEADGIIIADDLGRTKLWPRRGSRVHDPPGPAQPPRQQDKPPDLTSPECHTRRVPDLRTRERQIVESGNHDVLMAANGDYAKLFARQAEGYLQPAVK